MITKTVAAYFAGILSVAGSAKAGLIFFCLAIASPSYAVPIKYVYSGQLTDIRDYNGTGIHDLVRRRFLAV